MGSQHQHQFFCSRPPALVSTRSQFLVPQAPLGHSGPASSTLCFFSLFHFRRLASCHNFQSIKPFRGPPFFSTSFFSFPSYRRRLPKSNCLRILSNPSPAIFFLSQPSCHREYHSRHSLLLCRRFAQRLTSHHNTVIILLLRSIGKFDCDWTASAVKSHHLQEKNVQRGRRRAPVQPARPPARLIACSLAPPVRRLQNLILPANVQLPVSSVPSAPPLSQTSRSFSCGLPFPLSGPKIPAGNFCDTRETSSGALSQSFPRDGSLQSSSEAVASSASSNGPPPINRFSPTCLI